MLADLTLPLRSSPPLPGRHPACASPQLGSGPFALNHPDTPHLPLALTPPPPTPTATVNTVDETAHDESTHVIHIAGFDLDSLKSDALHEAHLDRDGHETSDLDDSEELQTYLWEDYAEWQESRLAAAYLCQDTDAMSVLTDISEDGELPTVTAALTRDQRRKKKKNARKRPHNAQQREKRRRQLEEKHRQRAGRVLTTLAPETLKVSTAGFRGCQVNPDTPPTTYRLIERDASKPLTVLVDAKGRIFAMRAAHGGSEEEREEFARGLLSAVKKVARSRRQGCAHAPRGNYSTRSFGISYGGGQERPQGLKNLVDPQALKEYKENRYVKTCIHHMKNVFHTWSPRLYHHYEDTMSELEAREGLSRPFPEIPFMATSLNIGPRTVTVRHKDFKNLSFGLCAIVALGEFDYKIGGRIRLEEAGVELEFAPGDVTFIPSASITHYNTDIQPGETRTSLTFYTAGQLFRWVRDGCRPVKTLSKEEQKQAEAEGDTYRKEGWAMYLSLEDIKRNLTPRTENFFNSKFYPSPRLSHSPIRTPLLNSPLENFTSPAMSKTVSFTPQPLHVKFKNATEFTVVHPNWDGAYYCPCSCGRSFMLKAFKAHAAENELLDSEPREDSSPLPQSAEPSASPELQSHPTLEELGYIVNTVGRFLICLGCHTPVLPAHASAHSHYQHNMAAFPLQRLESAIKQYSLFEDQKAFQQVFFTSRTTPSPAFRGIKVEQGFHCTRCFHARLTLQSLHSHWKDSHQGLPFPKHHTPAPVQHIYLCPTFGRWLPVLPLATSPASDASLQACLAAYNSLPDVVTEPDVATREPPPWLRKLGWLEWVSRYNIPDTLEFITFIKTHPTFKALSETFSTYVDKSMKQVLFKMPPQVRQILRSVTDVIKPLMFNAPDDDNTIKRYTKVVAFILLSHLLLHTVSDPPLPMLLNAEQLSKGRLLCELLDNQDTPAPLAAVEKAVQDVLMSLFIHTFKGPQTDATGDPVLMAVVWLNLQPDGSFKTPTQITQTFSAVQFVARAAAMMHVWDKGGPSTGETDYLQEMLKVHPLMRQGTSTPLGNIYGYWVILLKASMQEIGFPNFMYTSDDSLSFVYKGSPGTVDGLRDMVRYHLDKAEEVLFKDLLLGLAFPILGELGSTIYDDVSNSQVGYSFRTDSRNRYPDGFETFMQTVLGSEDSRHYDFFGVNVNGEWTWSKPNCLKWLNDCQEFLQHLLVASHMTHGQPVRGTELMSTSIANLANYPRSIFFLANEGVNALTPNKSESLTTARKLSPHYYCPQNSRQLFVYLLLVRPMEIAITQAVFPYAAANYKYYLFTGLNGRWTPGRLSTLLQESTERHLGVDSSFGLADMRQILIALLFTHCNSLYSEKESKSASEAFAEELGDRQANHSTRTARAHYGIQRSDLSDIPGNIVRALRAYNRGVHDFFRVGRPNSETKPSAENTGTVDFKSVLVAVQHEFNDVKEEFRVSLADMKTSLAHCLYSQIADTANAIVRAIKDETTSIPSCEDRPSASLLATLQRFDRGLRRFRSEEQALSLSHVLKERDHQLVILPTGEGKSLLWMLPAHTCWVDRAVVVVVPFVSLMIDLEERCYMHRITHSRWPPRGEDKPTLSYGVIFVSAEGGVSKDFYRFAQGLKAEGRLAMIVLEECHLILTASHYREDLPKLKELFGLGRPVLCTTATLPPHLVPSFKRQLNVSQINTIRRPNAYSKVRIEVVYTPDGNYGHMAVLKKATEWRSIVEKRGGSFLIICQKVPECRRLASELRVNAYYGDLESHVKEQIFRDFQQGNQPLLVATTAACTGFSLDHIRGVILDGPPYDIMTAAQTMGRAGRAGQETVACFIVDPTQRARIKDEDISGAGALDSMLFEKDVCRKANLTRFVEGKVMGCVSNEILCDVCEKKLVDGGGKYEGVRDLADLYKVGGVTQVPFARESMRSEKAIQELAIAHPEWVSKYPRVGVKPRDVEPNPLPTSEHVDSGVGDTLEVERQPQAVERVEVERQPQVVERVEVERQPQAVERAVCEEGRIEGEEEVSGVDGGVSTGVKRRAVEDKSVGRSVRARTRFQLPSPTPPFSMPFPTKPTPTPGLGRVLVPDTPSFQRVDSSSSSVTSHSDYPSSPVHASDPIEPFSSLPPGPRSRLHRVIISSVASSCSPSSSSSSIPLVMQTHQTLQKKQEVREFERKTLFVLEKLRGLCMLCWLLDEGLEDHWDTQCRKWRTESETVRSALKDLKIPPNSRREFMCYLCYVRSKTFSHLRHGEYGKQGMDKCELAHIFRPVIWASWHIKELRQGLISKFNPRDKRGSSIKEFDKFFDWCFDWYEGVGEKEVLNQEALVIWLTEQSEVFKSTFHFDTE